MSAVHVVKVPDEHAPPPLPGGRINQVVNNRSQVQKLVVYSEMQHGFIMLIVHLIQKKLKYGLCPHCTPGSLVSELIRTSFDYF